MAGTELGLGPGIWFYKPTLPETTGHCLSDVSVSPTLSAGACRKLPEESAMVPVSARPRDEHSTGGQELLGHRQLATGEASLPREGSEPKEQGPFLERTGKTF